MNLNDVYIYPWNIKSKGARLIGRGLGIKRILPPEHSQFVGSEDKVVINWGNSELSVEIKKCKLINTPTGVGRCTNKKSFFNRMQETEACRIPQFTSDSSVAQAWEEDGIVTVGRTKLSSYSGTDIVFMRDDLESWLGAVLYTKYIPKKHEFRVHFAFGKAFDFQQKVLPSSVPRDSVDWRVRNHANGFIFQRNDIKIPEDVVTQAEGAFKASALHFGAVDVVWNESQQKAYVLEINTAPGIEGTTAENYVNVFKTELESR